MITKMQVVSKTRNVTTIKITKSWFWGWFKYSYNVLGKTYYFSQGEKPDMYNWFFENTFSSCNYEMTDKLNNFIRIYNETDNLKEEKDGN